MEMLDVLAKYNISLADGLDNDDLVRMANAYRAMLATLKAETDTQASREKDARDSLIKSEANRAESIVKELRAVVANALEENGDIILCALVESIQKMKQDLYPLRDYYVTEYAKANKPERVKDDAEAVSRKEEAKALRKAINGVHLLMGQPALKIVDDEGVIVFETTNDNKAKETLPNLPDLPKGSTGTREGKGYKSRQMAYAINGEELPIGTNLYELVRNYLCDFENGFTCKIQDITKLISDSGKSAAPEGFANRWTVTVNDNEVCGWLPSDAVIEEDNDSEEDDD